MREYSSVSAPSADPSALTALMNDRAAQGWTVITIVPTGADLTAFLTRDTASGAANVSIGSAASGEPSGWAAAPDPAPAARPVSTGAAYGSTTPTVSAQPAAVASATAAASSTPAGWYHDPSGRYELRYWDGRQWTEHVARAGNQYTDPPVA
jgi:hypothetical protein